MKTILFFADGLTYPGKEGVSQHIFGLLDALSKVKSIRPVLLLCDRGTISKSQLERFNWTTVLVTHSVFYSYSKVKTVIDDIKPDIVQSYSAYQALLISSRYSIENRIPLVMEHHDVDEEALAHYELRNHNQNYQLDIIKIASLNRALSSRDANILIKRSPTRAHSFINIPSMVTPPPRLSADKLSSRDPNHVLFIGNGAYPPNRRAVELICEKIAPKLPLVTFHLIGRITEQYNVLQPNVIGHGMIDNIAPITEKVSTGIAPLDRGSGLKIKVMTYLSAGLQVVGTEVAFQGYSPSPVLTEASLDTFAEVLLSRISSYNADIYDLARKEYFENYLNDVNTNYLIETYQNLQYDAEVGDDSSAVTHFDAENLPWLKEFRESPYPICTETTYIN